MFRVLEEISGAHSFLIKKNRRSYGVLERCDAVSSASEGACDCRL